MKGSATTFATLYCAMQLASEGEAFTSSPSLAQSKMASSLNLVPDQANQLVAAYNAAALATSTSTETAPIKLEKEVVEEHKGAIASAKSFLTRVFHKPSVEHPHHDVVYYPMVGFRFFEGIDDVFPTTSHVSCTMPTKAQKEEEVFGWFSPSCGLDMFSDDVCHNPIGTEDLQ